MKVPAATTLMPLGTMTDRRQTAAAATSVAGPLSSQQPIPPPLSQRPATLDADAFPICDDMTDAGASRPGTPTPAAARTLVVLLMGCPSYAFPS
ncbi:hypothetical protein FB451DRAFT_1549366 [Mycena latifolia]|nr:hypothetical protein FB451DRAFT_1549366 [Mycena latifolia]